MGISDIRNKVLDRLYFG